MSPEDQAEAKRRLKSRNWAVALLLVGLVALFYFITLARISGA